MEFPLEIGYGAFKVSAHLIFETLAFILGFQYYTKLKSKTTDTISSENRLWILIGAAFGALIGSRLFGSLENPSEWFNSEHPILYFYLNKTIMGGLFGGLIGVETIKKLIGEKQSSGDLLTLPIIVAIMIGRIGCFSSGVHEPTFGIETDLPWGMNLGDGKLRHPIALYEILFLGFLWIIFKSLLTKNIFKSGIVFQLFMIVYFGFRFFIEFIKPSLKIWQQFSSIQLLCVLTFIYYSKTIYLFIFNRKKLLHD